MFDILIKGVLLGVSLSFMIGPLLFGLLEASLDRGFRAGISVAAGMWVCDVFYVGLVIFGADAFAAMTAAEGFRFYAGVFGGSLLCIFGLTSLLSSRKTVETEAHEVEEAAEKLLDTLDGPESPGAMPKHRSWGNLGFWLKGFFLNLINPGTIFFWLGIATALVVPSRWSKGESAVFFGGMLATLVVTDTLKVWAAKRVRQFLTPAHILATRRGIGLLLLIFGGVLIFKAFEGRF